MKHDPRIRPGHHRQTLRPLSAVHRHAADKRGAEPRHRGQQNAAGGAQRIAQRCLYAARDDLSVRQRAGDPQYRSAAANRAADPPRQRADPLSSRRGAGGDGAGPGAIAGAAPGRRRSAFSRPPEPLRLRSAVYRRAANGAQRPAHGSAGGPADGAPGRAAAGLHPFSRNRRQPRRPDHPADDPSGLTRPVEPPAAEGGTAAGLLVVARGGP